MKIIKLTVTGPLTDGFNQSIIEHFPSYLHLAIMKQGFSMIADYSWTSIKRDYLRRNTSGHPKSTRKKKGQCLVGLCLMLTWNLMLKAYFTLVPITRYIILRFQQQQQKNTGHAKRLKIHSLKRQIRYDMEFEL